MKQVCSPHIKNKNDFTCFNNIEIIAIANAYNDYILKNKESHSLPNIKTKIIFKNKSIEQIWKQIYNRLKHLCNKEHCWIDLPFINSIPNRKLKNKIKNFTFKPKMPKTKYSWLSTIDINHVLLQYSLLYKSFKFFGALPCDFYNYTKFDYNAIRKYDKVAFIFNLDKMSESGSHWVVLFIDNTKQTIEYFDSTGNSPNTCINRFIKLLQTVILIDYKYLENKKIHQRENSECGVYSIHYVVQRIKGKTFHNLSKKIIQDKQMNEYRNIIFRPHI